VFCEDSRAAIVENAWQAPTKYERDHLITQEEPPHGGTHPNRRILYACIPGRSKLEILKDIDLLIQSVRVCFRRPHCSAVCKCGGLA
jgi:hypothetical protein